MKKMMLFIVFFLTTLFVMPCSADNVTIELFQNSNDEYFVKYNGDLYACDDDECTFEVTNYTTSTNTTDYELSSKDMKKIAQYVALEIDIPACNEGAVNETRMIELLGNTREQTTDWIGGRITNTLIPEVEKFDELEQKLSEAEITIADLQSKAREYDDMKESKDDRISFLKDENSILKTLCGLLTLSFIAVIAFNSQAFKRIMELKKRKR